MTSKTLHFLVAMFLIASWSLSACGAASKKPVPTQEVTDAVPTQEIATPTEMTTTETPTAIETPTQAPIEEMPLHFTQYDDCLLVWEAHNTVTGVPMERLEEFGASENITGFELKTTWDNDGKTVSWVLSYKGTVIAQVTSSYADDSFMTYSPNGSLYYKNFNGVYAYYLEDGNTGAIPINKDRHSKCTLVAPTATPIKK